MPQRRVRKGPESFRPKGNDARIPLCGGSDFSSDPNQYSTDSRRRQDRNGIIGIQPAEAAFSIYQKRTRKAAFLAKAKKIGKNS